MPLIERVTLSGNRADWGGGALACDDESAPALTACLAAFNSASAGGGIFLRGNGPGPTLSCCDVFGNEGGEYGGPMEDPTGSDGNLSADPLFCDLAQQVYTLAIQSPCLPENNDCGVQMGFYGADCDLTSVPGEEDLPARFALGQNHPNPFNPETRIDFALPVKAEVTLTVYDASGRRVTRLLERAALPAGFHNLVWRARDGDGRDLASGVYFYRLEAGDFRAVRKMLMIK
jgi:hypothetical protein